MSQSLFNSMTYKFFHEMVVRARYIIINRIEINTRVMDMDVCALS